jgi:hypothetical protein
VRASALLLSVEHGPEWRTPQYSLPADRRVKEQVGALKCQLQGKSNDGSIGTVLVEILVCGLQDGFRGHIRQRWSVLSAGYPAANHDNVANEVKYQRFKTPKSPPKSPGGISNAILIQKNQKNLPKHNIIEALNSFHTNQTRPQSGQEWPRGRARTMFRHPLAPNIPQPIRVITQTTAAT